MEHFSKKIIRRFEGGEIDHQATGQHAREGREQLGICITVIAHFMGRSKESVQRLEAGELKWSGIVARSYADAIVKACAMSGICAAAAKEDYHAEA